MIVSAFQSSSRVVVTDGSFHPDYDIGTAAIVIEDKHHTPLIRCVLRTPGSASDVNPYRSELIGAYVGCLIIGILEEKFGGDGITVIIII